MKMVNIHNHTDKGSFDSVLSHDRFISRIQELNQEYIVQTDHGTMNAMISLAKKSYKAGLKYIPGVELYVTWGNKPIKQKDEFNRLYYHMLVLAKNNTGLKNLQNLVALSYSPDHFYYKPRIAIEELISHKEGLIITSGCLASLTSQTILFENSYKKTEDKDDFFKRNVDAAYLSGVSCDDHFGFDESILKTGELKGARSLDSLVDYFLKYFKDDFYLEIQDCGADDQLIVNQALIDLSERKGVPLVATSDAHYATPEDADTRRNMLMIRNNAIPDDNETSAEFYDGGKIHLKGFEELAQTLPEQAIYESWNIASKCDVKFDFNKTYFPSVTHLLPKETEEEIYFKRICDLGMTQRGLTGIPEYESRLLEEKQTIKDLGFIPYFICLYEILKKASDAQILIGAGRGSAAGSLVCYLLRITDIDPIRYGLFFSRFLNKSRVSLPDVDSDCSSEDREKLLHLIKEMFGEDKVGKVITFSGLKPRGTARDLGRILGLSDLGNKVASLVPPPLHGVEPTIEECFTYVPELSLPEYAPITNKMKDLQGLTRSEGVHAAGLVITPVPLADIVPYKIQEEKDGTSNIILQLSVEELEDAGLIKYDFLGLRTLTILKKTFEYLLKDGVKTTLDDIPDEDPLVYEYLRSTKDYGGLFQVEGSVGFSTLLSQIQPRKLEDISLVSGLYRPGPLGVGMDKIIIQRRSEGWVPRNDLDRALKDTYGCLVFQEQLMKIAVEFASFSEMDADSLRKAIGKKKPEELAKWKDIFFSRAQTSGRLSPNLIKEVWDSIESAGAYSFNLSHSISYAKLTYQCAYLKMTYPEHFIAAIISASSQNKEKLMTSLKTAKVSGIEILPPSIRKLESDTLPLSKGRVRLGLSACKTLKKSADQLIKIMETNKIETVFDLLKKVNRTKFNSLKAKSIAKAGILDELIGDLSINRSSLVKYIDDIYEWFRKNEEKQSQYDKWIEAKERREEQERLKSQGLDYGGRLVSVRKTPPELPAKPELSSYQEKEVDLLDEALNEYEILGLSIRNHPLDLLDLRIDLEPISNLECLAEERPRDSFAIAGICTQFKLIKTRKKDVMAEFVLEDQESIGRVNIFPSVYSKIAPKLPEGEAPDYSVVICKVKPKVDKYGNLTISCNDLIFLDLKDSNVKDFYSAKSAVQKIKTKPKDNSRKKHFNSFLDFLDFFYSEEPNFFDDEKNEISVRRLSFSKKSSISFSTS